jgi:hypothetical protein
LVDVLGWVITCLVHAANIRDEDGCEAVLDQAQAPVVLLLGKRWREL